MLPLLVSLVAALVALAGACALALWWLAKRRAGPRPTKTYVINLARSTDRLSRFAMEYAASDLATVPLERVEALDATKGEDWSRYLSPEALEKLMIAQRVGTRRAHPDLTPGAVGCFLSHVHVWRDITMSSAPFGLVFEDDSRVPPKMLRRLQDALRRAPRDWDLILFGYEGDGVPVVADMVRLPSFVRTHAYAITRSAAHYLSTSMLPIEKQLDWQMSDHIPKGLKVYGLVPKVGTAGHETTIQIPVQP